MLTSDDVTKLVADRNSELQLAAPSFTCVNTGDFTKLVAGCEEDLG